MEHTRNVGLTINGEFLELSVSNHKTLVDLLREDLQLIGTKKGCGTGDCGACTVLMDGKAVNSCLVLAVEADGAVIETIESLADGPTLNPIQQVFIDHGAVQCGFCSSGMIMSAKGLLDHITNPDDGQIRTAISGNLCRCTGYAKIIEAIKNLNSQ